MIENTPAMAMDGYHWLSMAYDYNNRHNTGANACFQCFSSILNQLLYNVNKSVSLIGFKTLYEMAVPSTRDLRQT